MVLGGCRSFLLLVTTVIFRLHGLSAVFRNFLKNVKTLEPKTYITILSIP